MAEKILNVYQRLAEVRKAVPYLKKEQQGKQYNYVGSSDVLGSLHEKINEVGLMLVPEVVGHHLTTFERTNAKGTPSNEYFTELDMTMTWVNVDEPSDTVKVSWYAQGVDLAGEKGVGKALTYGEKYFLLKFFNIATDKDDPDTFQDKIESKKPIAKISRDQSKELFDLAEEYAELRGMHGEDATDQALKWAAEQLELNSLDDASAEQADKAIEAFRNLISNHSKKNVSAEKQTAQQEPRQEKVQQIPSTDEAIDKYVSAIEKAGLDINRLNDEIAKMEGVSDIRDADKVRVLGHLKARYMKLKNDENKRQNQRQQEPQKAQQENLLEGRTTQPVNWGSK